ncbi:MAG: hypothetical protein KDB80_17480 [Planctomycetes bacterium]|nr:hypothetical protein [Planctomycetota bacterium]
MLTIAALFVVQWIEPEPSHTEAGSNVVVEARDADGSPLVGLPIEVRWPDGRVESIGATDASGNREFVPTEVGAYRVGAQLEGVELRAPLYANRPFARLWYALLCVPIGLGLLWRLVKRR